MITHFKLSSPPSLSIIEEEQEQYEKEEQETEVRLEDSTRTTIRSLR
jgi:hypothetical protein